MHSRELISGMRSQVAKSIFAYETDLGPEETVALLFHVVVDDAGHFLLPDLKAVYAHIVLDVLERPVETIHGGGHLLQLGHQFTGLRDTGSLFIPTFSSTAICHNLIFKYPWALLCKIHSTKVSKAR